MPTDEFSELRRGFEEAGLSEAEADEDPVGLFGRWYQEAQDSGIVLPEAFSVSTVSDGRPSSRMVLMRGFDERGLVFFTDYLSDKGSDIASNPSVAALFPWVPISRQIRVEGTAEKVSDSESDDYFGSRPRGSQVAARASSQSEAIENREALIAKVNEIEAEFDGADVSRPGNWGGYRIGLSRFEFWQGRADRLHDRIAFERTETGGWNRVRLSP